MKLSKLFLQNKLDKEEVFARINTAKINQEWRYILRKIKCKQMASDIQVIKNYSYNDIGRFDGFDDLIPFLSEV